MNFMEEGIEFESKLGDGADPDEGFFGKMFSAGVRMVTGESLFMTHFTHGEAAGAGWFRRTVPRNRHSRGSLTSRGGIICQKDSFLCAARGTRSV